MPVHCHIDLSAHSGSFCHLLLSFAASKFYGPSRTTISKLVQPWIEKYLSTLQLELTETPYLFFSNGDADRVQTSSQWTQTVKSAFARWSPQKIGVPPKTLRASFVTHLRSSDAAPEVLKSAAVTMRHLLDTQSSDVYDSMPLHTSNCQNIACRKMPVTRLRYCLSRGDS